jgi:hypothetical protein
LDFRDFYQYLYDQDDESLDNYFKEVWSWQGEYKKN